MADTREAGRKGSEITMKIVTSLMAIVVAMVVYMYTGLEKEVADNRSAARDLALSVAILEQKTNDHNHEAERWKSRIETAAEEIHNVKTNAAARKDPFTGEEGKELDRRIHANTTLIKECLKL